MVESENVCDGIDVTETKDGGIIKLIKREGSGDETPNEGANVFVHYVGTLEDGTQFDSSRDRGKPFDFPLGRGHVISGWEVGVETMKKGEICTLICKPEYAYGKPGKPPTIPQNSTLVFEIELLYWEDEKVTDDSLVSKKILKKGEGNDCVSDGGTVEVHLKGKVGERIFDERDVQFTVGEGGESDVIPGVDAAVKTMKKDEVSLINCDSSYAFGERGREDWEIKPSMSVEYEIHLKSFEQLKQPWELSSAERIDDAKLVKEKGTEYFKEEKLSLALGKFTRMVSLVESLVEERDLKQASPLILAGHLNVALCYLKLGKYPECIESCDKALCRDKNNVKALYRKGRANLAMHYPDEASEMFQSVIKLDPKNKDARTYYNITKKKIAEYRVKEKQIYANMFDKFAARDAKNAAQAESSLNPDGKDVFTKAEEEAKAIFGDELATADAGKKLENEKTAATTNNIDKDGDKTSEELTNRTKDTSEETAETPSSSETISS